MTVARLVRREGLELHLDRLDLVDGTPVIDLKPYIPGEDSAFSATRVRRIPHASFSPKILASFLVPVLERHLGSRAESPSARMALLAVVAAAKRFGIDPRRAGLSVAVSRADAAADALMALTGATFASCRIEISSRPGTLRFRFGFKGALLELRETEGTALAISEPGCSLDGVEQPESS